MYGYMPCIDCLTLKSDDTLMCPIKTFGPPGLTLDSSHELHRVALQVWRGTVSHILVEMLRRIAFTPVVGYGDF